MESKKQTHIAGWALVVSILSLAVTTIMAINQHKENIEVVVEKFFITEVNLEENLINCELEVIVANTSHTTTSLLKAKAYRNHSGLKAMEELDVSTTPVMPITLIQGGAERMVMHCQYRLDETEVAILNNNDSPLQALDGQRISVRVYSAKGATYISSARFDNAVLAIS